MPFRSRKCHGFPCYVEQREVSILALGVIGLEACHRLCELRIIRFRPHVFVTHQRRKFNVKIVGLSILSGRGLLSQRAGEGGRHLLQSVAPEVPFGREIGQCSRKPELVGDNRQLTNLQCQFFRGADAHGIVEFAEIPDLIDDRLFLRAPNNFFLRAQEAA